MVTAETIRQALRCGEPGCKCGTSKTDVHCPAHNSDKANFSVTEAEDGKPLVKCHVGCTQTQVIDALKARNLWPSRNGDRAKKFHILKEYGYVDAAGKLIYQNCRIGPIEPKEFRQRHPDGNGGWVWKMTGVKLVPYALPELLAANSVFICEGEKDCDNLAALGLPATTNVAGAGQWRKEYNRHFKSKAVVILPDNDKPGRAHAQQVAQHLHGVADVVRIVELPGLPPKGDVSDWLAAGGTVEQLKTLADAAPDWEPQADPSPKAPAQEAVAVEGVPQIVTTKRFLHDKATEAIKALETANQPLFLFRRSGSLARISLDEKDHPRIEPITDIQLRGILARCAYFLKETEKGLVATAPPMDLVKDILAMGEGNFPALEGIIQAPAMRLDGTVLNVPGYDPQTRLFFVKPANLSMPKIPEHPTEDDVDGYRGYLLEAICDFPFVEDSDRANALGLLITLPLRPAIPGNVPMAVITAPAPGTGKSLLQDTVANIGTGKSAPMAGLPRDDDEMRKFITSRLLAGDPLVSFDNLELPLWGPSLSRALTCTEWEDRILGGNTTARLPQRAVWIANGNNLKLRGDLPRRTFPIRLDAGLSRPWERQNFKHGNLIEWVSRYRGDFLAAILTIARAWFVAGKPEPKKAVPVMGGFEPWAKTIGGILSFAGVEGFLENLAQFHDEADIEGPEWELFLNTWAEVVGEKSETCQEVAAILRDNPEFASTLPDNLGNAFKDPEISFERALGRALARKEKRPYGENNLALQRVGTHKRAVLWKVGPLRMGELG